MSCWKYVYKESYYVFDETNYIYIKLATWEYPKVFNNKANDNSRERLSQDSRWTVTPLSYLKKYQH